MSEFEKAIEIVLQHEGGYVHDPGDPGGATKYGIAQRWHPTVDIKRLTREQAKDIYRREWWDRYGYDRIEDQAIAAKVLDLAVNLGPLNAHRLLQQALCDAGCPVEVDGIIGPQTLGAADRCPDPQKLLMALKLRAVAHYVELGRARYLKGWVRRAIA